MGGRTRTYQLLIFSSVFFLFLTLVGGGVVAADTNNADGSSDVADNVKDAIADKEAIRERLVRTFIIRGEWEKYGIPSKTPPVKPADKPEKPGAGVTPEEPPERPIGERGYEIILPPPKDGKDPVGMLPLPEEERALIRASPVPLPPTGRGVSPSIYGVSPPPSGIGALTTIYGVSPPAKPSSYFAVSTISAPLYVKPIVFISPIAVPPATNMKVPRVTAAYAMGEMYTGKDYPSMISGTEVSGTPAYTFMGDQITSPVGEYMVGMKDIGVDMMSFFKNNMHIVFIFSMFIMTMIIAIKTKRR